MAFLLTNNQSEYVILYQSSSTDYTMDNKALWPSLYATLFDICKYCINQRIANLFTQLTDWYTRLNKHN